MTAVENQKGRATPIHVQCSKCGRTFEGRLMAVGDRDENDRRFANLLKGAGWTGDYLNPLGKPLVCPRCNRKPPARKFWPVDPTDPKTWVKK